MWREILRERTFERVLPGHGRRIKRTPDEMRAKLGRLVARMKAET